MQTGFFRSARRALGQALGTSAALTLSIGMAHAAGANCNINTFPNPAVIDEGGSIDFSGQVSGKNPVTYSWTFAGGSPASSSQQNETVSYAAASGPGGYIATLDGTNSKGGTCSASVTVTVSPAATTTTTTSTPTTTTTTTTAPTTTTTTTTAATTSSTTTTSTTTSSTSGTTTTTTTLPPPVFDQQTDFKIMMNYELGMHCTGFEFAYCCVLPVYNSILAQVVKPNTIDPNTNAEYARLLEGDPNVGKDALGRETVVRDLELDGNGNFKKYVLKYWHEAQDRTGDPNGADQTSRLISAAEGHSLQAWNTSFNSAEVVNGALQYGGYNGSEGVLQGNKDLNGDPDLSDPTDNYQNAIWNHLYFYNGLEGEFACTAPVGNEGKRCSEDADCDLAGGDGVCNVTSNEDQKIRLGVSGQPGPFPAVAYPTDCGPAFHPLGPVTTDPDDPNNTVPNDCGTFSNGNVLTFSGDKGTVVYTQMKVLENLPIMLTSPDIWEALGLPLTPFEDSIDFFADPGLVDEDSVRPFVAMKAQMYDYDPNAPSGAGAATMDSNGNPVIGFGTAPIDIPNCERCHSNGPDGTVIDNPISEGGGTLVVANSPNNDPDLYALVQDEYDFWVAYYDIDTSAGDADWYARLKSAAISMLKAHDIQHGTGFADNYPGTECLIPGASNCVGGPLTNEDDIPQNTRLGHESVICQRCHADNVIAVVKSANCGLGNEEDGTESCAVGTLIPPITEAIHTNHRGVSMLDENDEPGIIAFSDDGGNGRDGSCQGCHPAHRSDGDMLGYPITLAGTNRYGGVGEDNRGANGGCFVGRDVHSNPGKDTDGAETPAHLNAVGQYLADNVASDGNGIWCTNCHNQLGQEMWKAEDMEDLVHGVGLNNPRGEPTLALVASAVGTDETQAISWLDPKASNDVDESFAIWAADPGLCAYVGDYVGGAGIDPAQDGAVATVEVSIGGGSCSNVGDLNAFQVPVDCGFVKFDICGSLDGDNEFSVNLVAGGIDSNGDVCTPSAANPGCVEQSPFCTTPDCVAAAQATLSSPCGPAAGDRCAVPVPFSAATDGRDHWLAAGEPHCADCHAAPYVEQSGNINAYPPFNYPRKASLMRYSKGHQNISCQGCHESIHGLYPVTPNIDTTTYAQAAALNHDGTHGPLKCGTCHQVNGAGVPSHIEDGLTYKGQPIKENYDAAVSWMHTFTAEADPRVDYCLNCHTDNSSQISLTNRTWTEHSYKGRSSREMMDKAESLQLTNVAGDPGEGFVDPANTVCTSCHGDRSGSLSRRGCTDKWKNHLIQGRASESAWEYMSKTYAGSTCGW